MKAKKVKCKQTNKKTESTASSKFSSLKLNLCELITGWGRTGNRRGGEGHLGNKESEQRTIT